MKGIQLVLLMGVGFISVIFLTRLGKRIMDILFLSSMVSTAAIFIIWPDITNKIAFKLGVGRGADLVFYISILIFWLIIVKLFDRIRKLEQMLTEITRNDAILQAKSLPGNEK
jgi:hypothetical protein